MRAAPNSRRVRIFLAEKGVKVPLVKVTLRPSGGIRLPIVKPYGYFRDTTHFLQESDRLSAEFAEKNPTCTVPLLELDDGTCVSESMAISRYIEELHPDPPLFGTSALEKAQIEMWNRRCEIEALGAVTESFRNFSPAFENRALVGSVNYAQIPELIDRGRARMRQFMDVLEKRFRHSEFVGGKKFSVADVTLLATLDFARLARTGPAPGDVHINRWYRQVSKRPSASA